MEQKTEMADNLLIVTLKEQLKNISDEPTHLALEIILDIFESISMNKLLQFMGVNDELSLIGYLTKHHSTGQMRENAMRLFKIQDDDVDYFRGSTAVELPDTFDWDGIDNQSFDTITQYADGLPLGDSIAKLRENNALPTDKNEIARTNLPISDLHLQIHQMQESVSKLSLQVASSVQHTTQSKRIKAVSVTDLQPYTTVLQQWCGRGGAYVVFDTQDHPLAGPFFEQSMKGNGNHYIVIFDTSGNVFGGFVSVPVSGHQKLNDPFAFLFSLHRQSDKHPTPQRYGIRPAMTQYAFSIGLGCAFSFGWNDLVVTGMSGKSASEPTSYYVMNADHKTLPISFNVRRLMVLAME